MINSFCLSLWSIPFICQFLSWETIWENLENCFLTKSQLKLFDIHVLVCLYHLLLTLSLCLHNMVTFFSSTTREHSWRVKHHTEMASSQDIYISDQTIMWHFDKSVLALYTKFIAHYLIDNQRMFNAGIDKSLLQWIYCKCLAWGHRLDWLCYLAGISQTAPTIFFKISGYVF